MVIKLTCLSVCNWKDLVTTWGCYCSSSYFITTNSRVGQVVQSCGSATQDLETGLNELLAIWLLPVGDCGSTLQSAGTCAAGSLVVTLQLCIFIIPSKHLQFISIASCCHKTYTSLTKHTQAFQCLLAPVFKWMCMWADQFSSHEDTEITWERTQLWVPGFHIHVIPCL